MSALPQVVRSQEEEVVEEPQVEITTEDTDVVEAPTVDKTSYAYLESVYKRVGIPGGGTVGDFVVGPGKVDVTLQPGQSKTTVLNITNRTGEKRKFNLTFEDAIGSKNTEQTIVLLGDDRGPYSLKDYLYVESESFILDHNQRAQVPVTISIPPDAEPGGLYGSVLVDTIAIEGQQGDTAGTAPQSAIVARIGTLFFITIPGATEYEGKLADFSTVPRQKFYQSSPITFGILTENTGTMHMAPYGELRVSNMFGEEVGYVELEPWFVLPESVRLREVSWQREFLMGKYTATVFINRSYKDENGEDIIDEMSYSFWVLPWKSVAGIFVGIFLVLFIIRAFFRTFEFKRKS